MSRIAKLQNKKFLPGEKYQSKETDEKQKASVISLGLDEIPKVRVRAFGTAARLAGWRVSVEFPFDGTPATVRYLDADGRVISAAAIRDLRLFEATLKKLHKQNNLAYEDEEPYLLILMKAGAKADTAISRALAKLKAVEKRLSNMDKFVNAVRTRAIDGTTEEERQLWNYLASQVDLTQTTVQDFIDDIVKPGYNKDLTPLLEEAGVTEWFIRHVFVADLPAYDTKPTVLSFFYGSEPFYVLRKELEIVKKDLKEEFFIRVVNTEPRSMLNKVELDKMAAEKSVAQMEEIFGKIPVPLLPVSMATSLITNDTTLKRLTNTGPRIPKAFPAGKRLANVHRFVLAHLMTGRSGAGPMEIEKLRSIATFNPAGVLVERLGDFHKIFHAAGHGPLRGHVRTNEETIQFVVRKAVTGMDRAAEEIMVKEISTSISEQAKLHTWSANDITRVPGDFSKLTVFKFPTMIKSEMNHNNKALFNKLMLGTETTIAKKEQNFFLYKSVLQFTEGLSPAAQAAVGSIQDEAIQIAAAKTALFRLATGSHDSFQKGEEDDVHSDGDSDDTADGL